MSFTTPHTLRNVLHLGGSRTTTWLLIRPFVAASCIRQLSSSAPNVWKAEATATRLKWSNNNRREWSSSAFRSAADRRRHEKVEASEQKTDKPDETFYMPPPPSAQNELHPPREEEVAESSYATRSSLEHVSPREATEPTNATTSAEHDSSQSPEPTSAEAQQIHESQREQDQPVDEATRQEQNKEGEEPLPSERQEQRWPLSKRLQHTMDDFLAKAALLSHQVNNYTGTDYSAIERLRRDIIDQEQVVKTAHSVVAEAKEDYTTSYSQQAASQKEVVGLLERKHSWSAADLERYMSLIRSEHLNEQAVQAAKEHLADAERNLEDARTRLEKKERKQYHEEQIWSDTIRRNSTWVTFGLMGLNIVLLLANLVIIEPWRRRRMVKEIRSALDEKTTTAQLVAPAEVQAQVDQVVEPAAQPLEELEEETAETVEAVTSTPETTTLAPEIFSDLQPEPVPDEETAVEEVALATGEVLPEEVVEMMEPVVEATEAVEEPIQRPRPENWEQRLKLWKENCATKFAFVKCKLQDLFSDRQVTLKRVDVTAIALEGAAAGIAVVGFLWVMFNPR